MTNPLDSVSKEITESLSNVNIYLARVESTVEDTASVKVAELTNEGVGSPKVAITANTTYNDVSPPKKRDTVVVIEIASTPLIVGVLSSPLDEETEHKRKERVINHRHSDTQVRIKEDGSVVIDVADDADISLGENGQKVARKGDSVSVDTSTGEGTITEGSDTVSSI